MTTVTKKHFVTFVKECNRCIKMLGLQSYDVRYTHSKLEDAHAQITVDYVKGVTHVELARVWDNSVGERLSTTTIKQTARHEIGHLLVGRLCCLARARFLTSSEIEEAGEEIANRLMGVL